MIRLSMVLLAAAGFAQASFASDGFFSSVERTKGILETFKESPGWVQLQPDGNHSWAYFPILVRARCAVSEVRFSVNSENLDLVFPLLPCDRYTPSALPVWAPLWVFAAELPPPLAQTVAVQVTYTDGSKSSVLTYVACSREGRRVCSRYVD